jgi:hypothetical protein
MIGRKGIGIMEGFQPGGSRRPRMFLNREPHVYVRRSRGRVARSVGEDVTMV